MGLGEIVIIAAIALVVIGPERFPEFARIVVRTIRDVRGYVEDAKQELDKELRPITKEIRQLEQYQPKRYFDDITNKSTPKSKPVDSPDLAEPEPAPSADSEAGPGTEGGAVNEPVSEAGGDGGEPPATTPYNPPPSEADYDRYPTKFPKKDAPGEGSFEEEEQYRD